MKASYVVYVEVGSLSRREAKHELKKVKKIFMKKACKKERWFFVPTRNSAGTHVMRLG